MSKDTAPTLAPLHLALLALVLAFSFLGSRGLWDPDEGRYTNVAVQMLDTADWVTPRRNDDTQHWTKPPLTYWAVAASVAVFGRNPWAARLPSALSYLACIWLAWRCARRLAPGTQALAALVYATMLMPFVAGQLITTDFLLAATQTLAVYGFIEWRFGPPPRRARWLWLMWVAFAAAFLAKGPPALVPMLALIVFSWLAPGERPRQWGHLLAGFGLFLALVLPWFVLTVSRNAGLLDYFLHAEVVDRVSSDRFSRHGEWYGWLEIYLPTLLLGTVPWTASLGSWLRQLPAAVRRWSSLPGRMPEAGALLVTLWILVPLLVFCLARSRLPLYVLPLLVPVALAIASTRAGAGKGLPRMRWILAWAVALVGFRIAAAAYPSANDASAWAREISERTQGKVEEVVFVEDTPRFGLRMYLGVEVESLSIDARQQPRFNPEFDESLRRELEETGNRENVVYVTKKKEWPQVVRKLDSLGFRTLQLGQPHGGRIIFEVRPVATAPAHRPASDEPAEQEYAPD